VAIRSVDKGSFQLDPQLEADCFVIGAWPESMLLLLNNKLTCWFIIVPITDVSEWYQLPAAQMSDVQGRIRSISKFLKEDLLADKLNIATIGNIVSQLHIHAIGRQEGDYCWPGVVWGAEQRELYLEEEARELMAKVKPYLGKDFIS